MGQVQIVDLPVIQDEVVYFEHRIGLISGYSRQATDREGSHFIRSFQADEPCALSIDTLWSNMKRLAVGLAGAALRLESPRMNAGNTIVIDRFGVNTYQPGGYIAPHIDNNEGVSLAFNAQGWGYALLSSRGTNGQKVGTTLRPGDLMVLPARMNGYGGIDQQTIHEVANVTPLSCSNGVRRSVALIYHG